MGLVRWLAATVAGLAALGEAALRVVGFGHPVLYDNRAAYGYRPLRNKTRPRFGGARVHINNLGLRGADVTPERPPGALRILFLGDSVTWGGSYVDDAQLFATIPPTPCDSGIPAASWRWRRSTRASTAGACRTSPAWSAPTASSPTPSAATSGC